MATGAQAALSVKSADVSVRNWQSISHAQGRGISFEDTTNVTALDVVGIGTISGGGPALYGSGGYRIFVDGVTSMVSSGGSGVTIAATYAVFIRNVASIVGSALGIEVDGGLVRTQLEVRGGAITITAPTAIELQDADVVVHSSTLTAGAVAILGDNSFVRLVQSIITGGIDITDGALHAVKSTVDGALTALRAVLTIDKATWGAGAWDLDTCSTALTNSSVAGSIDVVQTATMATSVAGAGAYTASGTAPNALLLAATTFSGVSSDTPYFSCVVLGEGSPDVTTSGDGAGVLYIGADASITAEGEGSGVLGIGKGMTITADTAVQCGAVAVTDLADITIGEDSCALAICGRAECSGTKSAAILIANDIDYGKNIGNAVYATYGGSLMSGVSMAHAQAFVGPLRVVFDVDEMAQASVSREGNVYLGSINYVKIQVGAQIVRIPPTYFSSYEVYAAETDFDPEYNALGTNF